MVIFWLFLAKMTSERFKIPLKPDQQSERCTDDKPAALFFDSDLIKQSRSLLLQMNEQKVIISEILLKSFPIVQKHPNN